MEEESDIAYVRFEEPGTEKERYVVSDQLEKLGTIGTWVLLFPCVSSHGWVHSPRSVLTWKAYLVDEDYFEDEIDKVSIPVSLLI